MPSSQYTAIPATPPRLADARRRSRRSDRGNRFDPGGRRAVRQIGHLGPRFQGQEPQQQPRAVHLNQALMMLAQEMISDTETNRLSSSTTPSSRRAVRSPRRRATGLATALHSASAARSCSWTATKSELLPGLRPALPSGAIPSLTPVDMAEAGGRVAVPALHRVPPQREELSRPGVPRTSEVRHVGGRSR